MAFRWKRRGERADASPQTNEAILLSSITRDQAVKIVGLPGEGLLHAQCVRLGLVVGARVNCIERLPGGTVVIESVRQEIAIGRTLGDQIRVSKVETIL